MDWQAIRRGKAPFWQYGLLFASGLGVLFPRTAMNLLTSLPRAILNSPKAFSNGKKALFNVRPKAFLPYKSMMTETATTVLSPIDMRYKNMAFQDWAMRTSILGVYLAQGILAIQYRRRPVETWLRNAGAWYLTVQVMLYTKDPKTLYSWLMSQPIVPQKAAHELLKPGASFIDNLKNPRRYLDRIINPLRPKWNYLDWCQKAGINLNELQIKEPTKVAVHKSAHWNTLDVNELRLIDSYRQRLIRRGQITKQARFLKQANEIERFMGKIVQMRLASVAVQAFATTILVGIMVPWAAIVLASPFDRYFERPKRRFVIDPKMSPTSKAAGLGPNPATAGGA